MTFRPPRILASLAMMSRDPARFGRQATNALDVLQRYIATPFVRPNENAIIVLGNSKAGTTVIAALLAEYGDLSVTLDFWPRLRRPETLAAVHAGERPFEAFVRRFRADFARDVVKDPHLTFLYPQLAQRFPQARFVMVMRDPRDNIRSILNRLELPGDLDDLDPEAYRRMRPLWEAILKGPWLDVEGNYVERLADRWSLGARVYLQHQEEIELIRYEDFVADKLGAITGLAERLGVEQRGCIEHKLDTRYQPPGDRDVGRREFFGPSNLRAIEARCAEAARALGYMDSGRNSTSEG
ncbi:MAG: sulfotransferase [Longimicrobiales bacterium]